MFEIKNYKHTNSISNTVQLFLLQNVYVGHFGLTKYTGYDPFTGEVTSIYCECCRKI